MAVMLTGQDSGVFVELEVQFRSMITPLAECRVVQKIGNKMTIVLFSSRERSLGIAVS